VRVLEEARRSLLIFCPSTCGGTCQENKIWCWSDLYISWNSSADFKCGMESPVEK